MRSLVAAIAATALAAALSPSLARAHSFADIADARVDDSARKASSAAEVTLVGSSRLAYRFTPGTPLSDRRVRDASDCRCDCHVTSANVDSKDPYTCECVCPVPHAGEKGIKGPKGLRGPRGRRLPVGPKGDKGYPGYTGDVGAAGPAGPKGIEGDDGVPGRDGKDARDERGPVGPRGPAGDVEKGMRGPVGPTGDRGKRGDQGKPGLEKTGPIGATGPLGPQGPRGERGAAGSVGGAGARGRVGPTGPDGMMAGPMDEKSAYVRVIAASACQQIAGGTDGARGSARAIFRAQDSPMVCGDTCATVCAKNGAGKCRGGIFIPRPGDKEGNMPASVPGALGLLSYRFAQGDCTTAGCDQANFCCCFAAKASEDPGSVLNVGGAVALFAADKIDTEDRKEIGKNYRVLSWADLSGHRMTASGDGDAAEAPTLRLGILNALPVVAFAGSGAGALSVPRKIVDASAGGFTVMAVVRPTTGGAILSDPSDVADGFRLSLGRSARANRYTLGIKVGGTEGARNVPFKGSGKDFVIVTYQFVQRKSIRATLNPALTSWGFEKTLDDSEVKIGAENLVLGAFAGDVAEVVAYSSALGQKDMHEVTCLLSKKWKVGTSYCKK